MAMSNEPRVAIAQNARKLHEDSSDSDSWSCVSDDLGSSMNIPRPLRRAPALQDGDGHGPGGHRFSPSRSTAAPTASLADGDAKRASTVVSVGRNRPAADLPPLPDPRTFGIPPPPVSPVRPVPAASSGGVGLGIGLGRAKSKRKTILERIEGWWDLGLLDKRQTLFGGGNKK